MQQMVFAGLIGSAFLLSATIFPREARARKPRIIHQPVWSARPGHSITVTARLRDDIVDVARLHLHYRKRGDRKFHRKRMRPGRQGAYEGCIPGRHVRGAVMHYYVEAVGVAGRRTAVSRLIVMTLSAAPPVLARGTSRVCRSSSHRSLRPTRVTLGRNVSRANVLALAERSNHRAERLYRAAIIVAVVGVVVASFPLAGFAAGPDVKGMIGVLVVSGTGGLGVLTGCGLAIGGAVYRSRARRLLSTLAMNPPRTTVFRWGFRF